MDRLVNPYLYNTDTSVKRTLGSVPLVSVLTVVTFCKLKMSLSINSTYNLQTFLGILPSAF